MQTPTALIFVEVRTFSSMWAFRRVVTSEHEVEDEIHNVLHKGSSDHDFRIVNMDEHLRHFK